MKQDGLSIISSYLDGILRQARKDNQNLIYHPNNEWVHYKLEFWCKRESEKSTLFTDLMIKQEEKFWKNFLRTWWRNLWGKNENIPRQ